MADNIAECRANLLAIFAEHLNLEESEALYQAAAYVLSQNLAYGNAISMKTDEGWPITFAEWGYLGKEKFQCRDFQFDTLTLSSTFSAEDLLFAQMGRHEIFTPTKTYPPLTVEDLAGSVP